MTDTPTYHVLALSGGGYRGLYTATVLSELEDVLGRPIAKRLRDYQSLNLSVPFFGL